MARRLTRLLEGNIDIKVLVAIAASALKYTLPHYVPAKPTSTPLVLGFSAPTIPGSLVCPLYLICTCTLFAGISGPLLRLPTCGKS